MRTCVHPYLTSILAARVWVQPCSTQKKRRCVQFAVSCPLRSNHAVKRAHFRLFLERFL